MLSPVLILYIRDQYHNLPVTMVVVVLESLKQLAPWAAAWTL